jgi:hypothetical protein
MVVCVWNVGLWIGRVLWIVVRVWVSLVSEEIGGRVCWYGIGEGSRRNVGGRVGVRIGFVKGVLRVGIGVGLMVCHGIIIGSMFITLVLLVV